GGPRAFSEPETRAVCGFCSTFDVKRLYSFHSQGEEVYWYYGRRTPLAGRDIAEEFANACGYKVCMPKGMAANGGLKDWYIETFGRPGFTIEIGRGENPLPIKEFDEIYEKIKPALAKALVM
ncbi:MAG: gamma-D-glutamyl-meso-diaminopimelate peptidase, partial [Oscillospiraceae bacterium]|nr:gamma-D-glutamyl-meso-diaminopimelate peptidase [Oscillospiraceae bacterium]